MSVYRLMVLSMSIAKRRIRPVDYTVLANSEEDRTHWLKMRETGLGASDVSTIFGVNPWESSYTLFMKKRGELPATADNMKMKMGRMLEPIVAELFAEETGRKVWRGLGNSLLRSNAYPWLLATPDFEQRDPAANDDGLLECKTTGSENASDWEHSVPLYYEIQVQQQLLVAGRKYSSLACLIGGQSFKFQHLGRHEAFQRTLIQKTKAFWDQVQSGEAPPADTSPSTFNTLKQLREDGRAIDLPPMVLAWHDAKMAAREKRLALEKEEAECERLIASTMERAAVGVLPDGRGVYKFQTVPGYEVAAYKVAERRDLKFSKKRNV
jgi:putative phage-type endonuclease